jgi:hypothetical protein
VVGGHEHRADGAAVGATPREAWRLVGKMPVAPLHQGDQRDGELAPLLRQLVLETRRSLAVGGSLQDPFVDQPGEAVTEDVSRDTEALLELVEAPQPEEDVSHDQERPPLADELERARDRAVLALVRSLEHARTLAGELREATHY